MIDKLGLYPGCLYISDVNGKVYKYDYDNCMWVQDTDLRTVEFNLNDDSGLKTRKLVKNVVGDSGIGSIPGKHFAGWFTAESGGDYVSPDTSVEEGYLTRLYAHWDGVQVFLGNGVTLTVDGTAYTGWATMPIGGTATCISETIVEGETPALKVVVTGFVNGETPATIKGYVAPTVEASDLSEGFYQPGLPEERLRTIRSSTWPEA